MPPTVFDANAQLNSLGCSGLTVRMKLLYEANRLSVRLLRRLMFEDRCEAWKNGPVYPALWQNPHGAGDISQLSAVDQAILTFVARKLGRASGKNLSARSHRFPEWVASRTERGNMPITFEAIREALLNEGSLFIDDKGHAIHTVPIANSRFKELKFYVGTIMPLQHV